jgi:hypothetical protein
MNSLLLGQGKRPEPVEQVLALFFCRQSSQAANGRRSAMYSG